MHALRSPTFLPIEYRSLELVHRITVSQYGPIIPITEALCGYIIILGAFMLIRHSRELDKTAFGIVTMWVTSMLLLFTWILRFGGIFFTGSKKTINSWKYWRESGNVIWNSTSTLKYMKQFSKSCRPLAIEFPGYYRISNVSVLKFWQGAIRGVVRVLLAFK
ncbi:uncharacterized protein LOC118436251 [Folsomia candida]|nr:uncharacterized protein LOC118436251 [Folsomia candida]